MENKDFFTAIKKRRSIYALKKESPISDDRIQELVEEAVKHGPTSFNSQSTRAVVLFGGEHDKLWDITTETLRKIVPEDSFSGTEEKMNAFKSAYGTVLFFSDESIIQSLQEEFKLYADNFPVWGEHATGILQYIVWTSFAVEGLGASLQHYNPLIDKSVRKEWGIPESWKLTGQMPFGVPAEPAGEKEFAPISDRVKVFK